MAAYFITTDTRGQSFTVNPKVTAIGRGWVIVAYCDDAGKYGGLYTSIVGWAAIGRQFKHGWKRKRDAEHELNVALRDGILRLEDRTKA